MRSRIPRRGRSGAVAGASALALVLVAAPGSAQDLGTDCELREYASIDSRAPAPGMRTSWLAMPLLVCPDGTRLRADSAVVYEQDRRAELIGGVRYETEDRLLEADLADYYEQEARLVARGDVVLTELPDSSVIRSDTLIQLGRTDSRPEQQVTASGGRPSLHVPQRTSEEGEDAAAYDVIADRLRFEGERFFWADGEAEVIREDFRADADSLAFDRETGQLFLNGNARMEGEADVEGDRITLSMPGDVLESILVRNGGRLTTEDLELLGEEIRITLVEERIERLVAVHRPGEGEVQPPRPRAETDEFVLEADSLDVRSPGEVLETVYAVGNARGETRGRGPSIAVVAPEPTDEVEVPEPGFLPPITESDWIEGDEIIASFAPAPPEAEIDTTDVVQADDDGEGERSRYVLEQLRAVGNARTLYRSPPDTVEGEEVEETGDDEVEEEEMGADQADGGEAVEGDFSRWSISYVVAGEISIYMVDGDVDRMEAQDRVIGIQLEPRRREAAGNAGADENAQERAPEVDAWR